VISAAKLTHVGSHKILKFYMSDVIHNNSRPNTHYIVVIPALKLKNVKSDTMRLKFNMLGISLQVLLLCIIV
jgi:hypothetical protein